MSLASQLNSKRNRNLGIDTTNFNYIKLSELFSGNDPETTYTVLGAYQHDGQYGLESVVIIDGFMVNLPHHLNDDVKAILENIDVIENHKLGFKITPYTSKYGKFYTVQWIDL